MKGEACWRARASITATMALKLRTRPSAEGPSSGTATSSMKDFSGTARQAGWTPVSGMGPGPRA
eukprot:14603817-Alexandrium_andersonii.AAC.1